MKPSLLGCALVLLASLGTAKAQILQNGSFQTGNFADWTVQYAPTTDLYIQSGSIPPTGAFPGTNDAAVFGTPGTTFDYISQSFASQIGQTYQLTFALETFGNPNEFLANIGGQLNASPSLPGTAGGNPNYITGGVTSDINNTSTDAWTVYTLDFKATSTTTDVIFGGLNNNPTGVDYLTDVSVTETTPEPSTWALLSCGAVFLLAVRRRLAPRDSSVGFWIGKT